MLRIRKHLSLVCALMVSGVILIRVFEIARLPRENVFAAVPDDAFYYLQLARQIGNSGNWSMDGVHPASGFHALYAWALGGAFALGWEPDAFAAFVIIGIVSALIVGLAVYLLSSSMVRVFSAWMPLFVATVFLTPIALVNATLLVEAPLLILTASLCVWAIVGGGGLANKRVWLLVIVGLLGSLARSDFFILPAGLVVGYLFAAFATRSFSGFRRSLWVLVGTVLGLVVVGCQTWIISGNIVQSSVRVKDHWTQVLGTNESWVSWLISNVWPSRPEFFIRIIDDSLHTPQWVLLFVLVSVAFALLVRRSADTYSPSAFAFLLASPVSVLLAFYIYSQNIAGQLWYAATFIVPVTFGLCALVQIICGRFLFLIGVCLLAGQLFMSSGRIQDLPYPWQIDLARVAASVSSLRLDGLGSWNSGIISYLSVKPVTNLDGLVNDDAVPFILNNRLPDFIVKNKIKYLLDYETTVRGGDKTNLQLGLGAGNFADCLAPLNTRIEKPSATAQPIPLIFVIDDGCLIRLNPTAKIS